MNPSQEKLAIGALIVGILVLGALLVWLVSARHAPIGASLPKEFSKSLHDGLAQEIEGNNALLDDLKQTNPPDQNREQFYLLQNVAGSYQRELEWLQEKENASFLELQNTENNLVARNALQKEIAYYVLFQYMQQLNIQTAQVVSDPAFDIDETIRQTKQELPFLHEGSLLPNAKIKEFAQDSGLTEIEIEAGIKETVASFLRFKKSEFEESVTKYEKAVMGAQILSWRFTLAAANQPTQ